MSTQAMKPSQCQPVISTKASVIVAPKREFQAPEKSHVPNLEFGRRCPRQNDSLRVPLPSRHGDVFGHALLRTGANFGALAFVPEEDEGARDVDAGIGAGNNAD